MQVPSPVLQALSEILAAQSPQFAARLKQRLTATLQAKDEPAFDERKFGFKGFRDFLERGTQGLFLVEPSTVGSDVMVTPVGAKNHSIPTAPFAVGTSHSIRNDVWQAFTNPDPARLRFWGRHSFQVRHYLRGEDSPHSREVLDSPEAFIEIAPITAETQVSWMQQFTDQQTIPEERRKVIESILTKTYSSGINAAFTGALGELGSQWRQQRIRHVLLAIHAWADTHGVPHERLSLRTPSERDSSLVMAGTEKPFRNDHVGSGGIQDPRERAVRLLDMLSDEEISRVVVPILLSTLLVKGKS